MILFVHQQLTNTDLAPSDPVSLHTNKYVYTSLSDLVSWHINKNVYTSPSDPRPSPVTSYFAYTLVLTRT